MVKLLAQGNSRGNSRLTTTGISPLHYSFLYLYNVFKIVSKLVAIYNLTNLLSIVRDRIITLLHKFT